MKIKLFILTLSIAINLSCVENVITIHILPNGQTFLQIVSTGDSTDIIDGDFKHPIYEDQSSSYEIIKSDSVWKAITKIILRDSSSLLLSMFIMTKVHFMEVQKLRVRIYYMTTTKNLI